MPRKHIAKRSSPTRSRTSPPSHRYEPPPLTKAKLESRTEDTRLIHDALRGKQDAYKKLLKKYHDQIFHLILRIVRQRALVEDLTQEVFMKAFVSLKNFNEEYAFTTWLFKIATNSSIDYLRKKKLETLSIDKPVETEDSDYTIQLPDTTYQPETTLIQRQRSKLIEEAIHSLPERYRRVIILRHNEERDYAEIARMLKLPIGTVKAHIFRARELLNKYLRDKIGYY